jgi:hypothetical protein
MGIIDRMNATPTPPEKTTHPSWLHRIAGWLFDTFLVLLILTGIFFRTNWVNWSQDTNLHPDEYGLTSTLTQLAIPKNLSDYFNTRLSPLSPYQKYDLGGQPAQPGPDNRMRWGQLPITIIRWAGEISGNTGYGEIRLLGRQLSALADMLSLLLIFLIGRKLYNNRVGLLAAALSALAVMQIQQSHFMTVDNFGALFTTLALYACVHIAATPPVTRSTQGDSKTYQLARLAWGWYLLFGLAFGMALACKVNLLPVGGMVLVAAFISIADLKLKSMNDFQRITAVTIALLVFGIVAGALTFRVSQPISFRAASGDTSIFTLHPNQDWVDSMLVASSESNGQGGGPPGEQWAHRPAILFPLSNMLLWGMGLPLGLTAWLCFGWALWQLLRSGKNWRAHLLPLVWTGGYFLFMGTRWVKSIRYFLPIYPFLALLAAWGLMEIWKWSVQSAAPARRARRMFFSSSLIGLTLIGTLAWAAAFVQAVYDTPHTRIQATRWIFQNIPGPFELALQTSDGVRFNQPLTAPDNLQIYAAQPYIIPFRLQNPGRLLEISLPHVQASAAMLLHVSISENPNGGVALAAADIPVGATRSQVSASFPGIVLAAGRSYFLTATPIGAGTVTVFRTMLANESWDEGLPVPFDGYDPFGQLYRGTTMEIRWPDDLHKRDVMLNTLADADYLIVPSQRAIWSTCRIPRTYPMTMAYYRALFDGRLGFEQVASFSAPFKLGPLWISDVGGTLAWNKTPALPLFNHSLLAAEEAFSVYDHPPVWIFKKSATFSLRRAADILDAVNLSAVVVQSPLNADGDWCPAQ